MSSVRHVRWLGRSRRLPLLLGKDGVATDELLGAFSVRLEMADIRVAQMRRLDTADVHYMAAFRLNGRPYETDARLDAAEMYRRNSRDSIADAIVRAVSNSVARELLLELVKSGQLTELPR